MSAQLNVGSLTTEDDHNGAAVYWDNEGGMFWCDHCEKYVAFTKDDEVSYAAEKGHLQEDHQ